MVLPAAGGLEVVEEHLATMAHVAETTGAPVPHVDRMRDHWWWRPGWQAGRRFYTWHITFDEDTVGQDRAALHRLVCDYQAHLGMPGLDLVPLEWLHLTMQGVGFVDEVSDQDIARIAEAARSRCAHLPPVTVALGPARLRPEAVGLYVVPEEPVGQVRAAIRAAVAEVWGIDRVPELEGGFTPHVSLAYSNMDGPAEPLAAMLAKLPPASVMVTIRAAQLIVLGRDDHVYRWTTRATVPLAGAPAATERAGEGPRAQG
jgi:2'-5' RNA ligase